MQPMAKKPALIQRRKGVATMSFCCTPDLADAIKRHAETEGYTVSSVISVGMALYLERRGVTWRDPKART